MLMHWPFSLQCAACLRCDVKQGSGLWCEACETLVEYSPRSALASTLTGAVSQYAVGPIILDEPATAAASSVRTAWLYVGAVRDAILAFKYNSRFDIGKRLAVHAMKQFGEALGQFDCVVPIASHPSRLRLHGFNPAVVVAKEVAVAWGLPVVHALKRTKFEGAQSHKTYAERKSALLDAFQVSVNLNGAAIVLVDDVRTTGATLEAAKEALLSAGARDVLQLALAQTPRMKNTDDVETRPNVKQKQRP